jgi:uncharacterized protein YceK
MQRLSRKIREKRSNGDCSMKRMTTVMAVSLVLSGCATTFRPTDPSAGTSYISTASGNTQNASASGAAQIAFDQANYECKRDVAQAAQGRSVGASWNNNNVASRNTAAGWILGNLVGGAIADHQMYIDCMRAHGYSQQN